MRQEWVISETSFLPANTMLSRLLCDCLLGELLSPCWWSIKVSLTFGHSLSRSASLPFSTAETNLEVQLISEWHELCADPRENKSFFYGNIWGQKQLRQTKSPKVSKTVSAICRVDSKQFFRHNHNPLWMFVTRIFIEWLEGDRYCVRGLYGDNCSHKKMLMWTPAHMTAKR